MGKPVGEEMRVIAQAKRDENGNVLSVPVAAEVQDVIDAWAEEHGEDLRERLEPFGLSNYNIVRPEYRRIVLDGEDNGTGLGTMLAALVAQTEVRR